MENKEILTKMSEVGDQIKHVQEKVTLDGKQNAVDFANIKENSEKAAVKMEEIQAEQIKMNAGETIERLFAIEKAITSQKNVSDETKEEHKVSFYNYLRKGGLPSNDSIEAFCAEVAKKTLINTDESKIQAYTKALVEGSNADGGFFVTPERSASMITRIFETSPMRSIGSVVTTSSNAYEMVLDDDEAACGWVGEVTARAVTDTPEVGLLTIPVHESYAKPQATQRMLDDAGFDIESWLQTKVVDKISRTENTAFTTGDGSLKPKGYMSYPAWDSAGTYQRDAIERYTATGTAATLDEPDDLIAMQNTLHDAYQMGANWTGNRATFSTIMSLADGEGRYLFNPIMLKTGTDRVLLGKPYVIMADMVNVGSATLPLAYGNFSAGYTVVDRFGIRVLRDPFSNKPYVQFYSTKRTGGACSNFEAIKILLMN